MSVNDSNKPETTVDPNPVAEGSAAEGTSKTDSKTPLISRRKLTYVAPALASRAMFYGAAGCGKGNPRLHSCVVLRRGSS